MNRIFNLLFFCLFFITPMAGLFSQGHEARLGQIDIFHYRFEIGLSDQSDKITGKAEISIGLLNHDGEVVLDLVAENAGGGMKVNSVKIDGELAQFSHSGEELKIKVKKGDPVGTIRKFTIEYEGTPADGLIISSNKHGDRTFFGDNWPNRAHNWLPTVDHPSDKATVEFIVTAPVHYEVVANGKMIEESRVAGGMKRTHWKTDVKLPTKVMVIGAADFAVGYAGAVEGIPVHTWAFYQQRDHGFSDYSQAVDILRYYKNLIGPYPYEKLANVQSRTRYGGMENASCIFYSESSVTGDGSAQALIAHEIVHQWFGNSASEANWHHIWLSEGFATYLTNLYYEQVHSVDTFAGRMRADRARVISFPLAFKSPVVDPSVTDYNRLLNPNSYQKGGWVLHMLRQEIGDDAFFKGLKLYYDRFKLSNALTSDLQKVMEETGGKKLDWFFEQWIFRAGHPKLKLSWKFKKKGLLEVKVDQEQEGKPFKIKVEVGIRMHGGKMYTRTLEMNEASGGFTADMKLAPEEVVLDPNVKLLFQEVEK